MYQSTIFKAVHELYARLEHQPASVPVGGIAVPTPSALTRGCAPDGTVVVSLVEFSGRAWLDHFIIDVGSSAGMAVVPRNPVAFGRPRANETVIFDGNQLGTEAQVRATLKTWRECLKLS